MAELAAYASDGWPAQPAHYTCLTLGGGPRTAAGEVLTALVAQWLTVQVSGAARDAPAVIIAGAGEINRLQLERLADACEMRGVPITLLFRHLREGAAGMLGGGTTAFMRLGNHTEAEQAAAYLGPRHAVEPAALQNLPDCALLLADRSGGTLTLRAVECDPAISTSPGASAAEELEPAWPPDDQPPELPWWQRNQPPPRKR